jgi:hypothetical protein
MGRALETSDQATLLVSLTRNIPGAIYRCALDRDWTMQLIGEEVERAGVRQASPSGGQASPLVAAPGTCTASP